MIPLQYPPWFYCICCLFMDFIDGSCILALLSSASLESSNLDSFITAMKRFKPTDATTNPSLVLQAASQPQYAHLVDEAINYAKTNARYE